jgi:hypothetical protein
LLPWRAAPLTWQGDLDVRMMDGLHGYIEKQIEQSVAKRMRDASSAAAYEQSIRPNRRRF